MNRAIVAVVAVALALGLGTALYFVFSDSGHQPKPVDVAGTQVQAPTRVGGATPEAGKPPITTRVGEPAPIKGTAFKESADASPEGDIGGIVTAVGGERLDGATCQLIEDVSPMRDRTQEGEVRETTQTREGGFFLFSRGSLSLVDRYVIKVSHPGYVTHRKSWDVRKDGGTIYIEMEPGNMISGAVRTVSGAGISFATVTVYDQASTLDPGGSVETTTTADASGAYSFANVGAGMKRLQASADGYASASRHAIQVEHGKGLSHVDFALNEGATMAGVVIAADGMPVEGAYVTARPVRIGPPPEHRKEGFEPSEAAAKLSERVVDGARIEGMTDAEAAKKLQYEEQERVKSDGDPSGRDRARDAMMKDRLSRANQGNAAASQDALARAITQKKPLGQAGATAQTTLSTRSGPDGTFQFKGAEIGTYAITVVRAGFTPAPQRTVESPSHGETFTLQPTARITGRVVDDETGRPVLAFTIAQTSDPEAVMLPNHGRQRFGPPKTQDGAFEFVDVRPGRLYLVAEAPGFAGGRSAEMHIGPSERRDGIEIRMVRGATIRGRVVDHQGKPVAGANVSPSQARGSGPGGDAAGIFVEVLTRGLRRDDRDARTDLNGQFVLPNLLSGVYKLDISHPEFAPKTTDPITVAQGDVTIPDTTLGRGAGIRGRVLLPDGSPDRKAQVTVSRVGGGGLPATPGGTTAHTDADGRFAFNGLMPGQYRVMASMRNGMTDFLVVFQSAQSGANTITLGEGEIREIDL